MKGTKRIARRLMLGCLLALLAGCGEQADIQHFKVPKPPQDKPPVIWELPEGWKSLPVKKGPFAAYATFAVGANSELNVHRFGENVGPQLKETLPNVERWRRTDLGLPPLESPDALAKVTSKFELAGKPATYVDMVGPGVPGKNAKGTLRLLGVILPTDNAVWFFKLVGPKDEVGKLKEVFDRFLKSVRIEKD